VALQGRCLTPTLRGWDWLAADPETRWRWLWEAWPRDPALWRLYRLPGHTHPSSLARFQSLLPRLAQAAGVEYNAVVPNAVVPNAVVPNAVVPNAGDWQNTADFVAALLSTHVSPADEWEHWDPEFHTRALTDFITGFLTHLGLAECHSETRRAKESPALSAPPLQAGGRGASTCFRLTPLGAWLASGACATPAPFSLPERRAGAGPEQRRRDEGQTPFSLPGRRVPLPPATRDEGQTPFSLPGRRAGDEGSSPFLLAPAPDGRLLIQLPQHPHLAHLARLIAISDSDSDRDERLSLSQSLSLSSSALNRARGHGMHLQEILGLLEEATGTPLPHAVRTTLRQWDDDGARLTLSRLAVLECDDPDVLSDLARKRRFRSRITRTLSPRALVLDDHTLDAAIRHLRRITEGDSDRDSAGRLSLRLIAIPDSDRDSESRSSQSLSLSLSGSGYLAGLVYQELGRFIRLGTASFPPAPFPASVLMEMKQSLSSVELAAAEAHAARVLESLAAALDGWTPLPSPQPGLDQDELRPQIEAAIREGKTLRLAYWTAGRGVLTRREVEPHRIEQRGYTLYLIGHCRAARAERVFRLDRISEIEIRDRDSKDWTPDFDE